MNHEHGIFEVEGKDPHGKSFKAEVDAIELRHVPESVEAEMHQTFGERTRSIIGQVNESGGTIRKIKRVD